MNHSTALATSILAVVLTACAANSEADDAAAADETVESSSAAALTESTATAGVPKSVLASYRLWSVTGANIPAEPPARSGCSSPLDAVRYSVFACKDPSGNDVKPSTFASSGVSCSAHDGSGVTAVQAACLGGWLLTIGAINGKPIPSNVILSGVNKVAAAVTRVVLLECPTPPAGLAQHNVIYKAVYNNGVFASRVPEGCSAYEVGAP